MALYLAMKAPALLPLIVLAATLLPACGGSDSPDQEAATQETPASPTATAAPTPSPTPSPSPIALELAQVGHLDIPAAADIWANGEVAFVGGRCGGGGVSIVDVSHPALPELVATAEDQPNTSADDVMVIDVSTPFFQGPLMAVGLQACPPDTVQTFKGLELWDVNDPAQPARLGLFDVGPLPSGGVHELYLFQREERVFVLLAVPSSEAFHPEGLGDFRIVEVTDPRNPQQLADWGIGKDGGLAFGAPDYEGLLPDDVSPDDFSPRSDCTPAAGEEPLCRGDIPWVIAHSASANEDGTRAYISYWDAGMVILDIADPARPLLLGRAVEPAGDEGNLHSAIEVPGGKLAITTDEDFVHTEEVGGDDGSEEGVTTTPRPDDHWGYARIWDISDPSEPTEIARFTTPNAESNRGGGLFTVHNPEVHGDLLFLSWYTDGVRVVDISDPSSPREVASFVPPDVEYFGETSPPYVWGVHVEGDLVFLSDMAGGLYILEMSPAG